MNDAVWAGILIGVCVILVIALGIEFVRLRMDERQQRQDARTFFNPEDLRD